MKESLLHAMRTIPGKLASKRSHDKHRLCMFVSCNLCELLRRAVFIRVLTFECHSIKLHVKDTPESIVHDIGLDTATSRL